MTFKRVYGIFFCVVLFMLRGVSVYAQTDARFTVRFNAGETSISPLVQDNESQLFALNRYFNSLQGSETPLLLHITGLCSFEGKEKHNYRLAELRAMSVIDYLEAHYNLSSFAVIKHSVVAEDWNYVEYELRKMNTSGAREALAMIQRFDDYDLREEALRRMPNHQLWDYLMGRISPSRRCVITIDTLPLPAVAPASVGETAQYAVLHSEKKSSTDETLSAYAKGLYKFSSIHSRASYPIALKTNLLFDAVTALNVEIEMPLDRNWSVAAEWLFPWWVSRDNRYCMEVLSGTIEGRYWFSGKRSLNGWFVGLYAGGGLYDLQYQTKGYQGEFCNTGVSGGFSFPIAGRFNLELSVGAGYLVSQYRYYTPKADYSVLAYQYDGVFSFIGPTRAKVSLVWNLGDATYFNKRR